MEAIGAKLPAGLIVKEENAGRLPDQLVLRVTDDLRGRRVDPDEMAFLAALLMILYSL